MNRKAFLENINTAVKAVRSQILRTFLTVLIIAIGITALISIITATKALENKITSEFSALGSNTFDIRANNTQSRRGGKAAKVYDPISYREAMMFKSKYGRNDVVSVSSFAAFGSTLKHQSETTNPNVSILGTDENYLKLSGYEIEDGRNFSNSEVTLGNRVAILGKDIVKKLFTNESKAVGSFISIDSRRYHVIGVLKSKGNSFGMGGDNQCFIPISDVKKTYDSNNSYRPNIMVSDARDLDLAVEESTGIMKGIRRDPVGQDSFRIRKSDSTASLVIDNLNQITMAATFLGFITLLGAGIGLMNIMLVSVTERTREIGVRKAIGASSSLIRQQFLIEAILIGQIGGAAGIIFGVLFGNVTALILGTGFTVPWGWLIVGVVLCFIVSIASGYYPAKKAASLDPIESLRYE